jgi:hypothetical protein
MALLKQQEMKMDMNCELTMCELDEVTGGGLWDKIVGALVGEVVHAVLHSDGGFPLQVLNGVLGTIGQKPA